MANDIKNFINNYEESHQNKPANSALRPPMVSQYKVYRPFEKVFVDLLGTYPRSKRGNIGLLIVLDDLTKFPLLKPLKKLDTKHIIEYMDEMVFPIFGTPESLLNDNGKQFKNKLFKEFLDHSGIKQIFTAIYSSQANQSERVKRSIVTGTRTYVGHYQTNWDRNISEIAESIRSSYHQTIEHIPYCALFGQQMATNGSDYLLFRNLQSLEGEYIDRKDKLALVRKEIVGNIYKAFETSAKGYNLRSAIKDIKVGETLYRRNFTQSDRHKKIQ